MDAMPMQRLAPYWRVLVADDHRVVGEGVVRLLKDSFDDVRLVLSGQELLRAVRDGAVDIVVTDVSMDDMTGIDAMRLLRAEGDMTPFVFLSMHHDCGIVAEAIRGGASGYVLKAAAGDELLHAMDEVAAGRVYIASGLAAMTITAAERTERHVFTDKQRRILDWVAQGLRSKQIAYELGIAEATVKAHMTALMRKLNVRNRTQVAIAAEAMAHPLS